MNIPAKPLSVFITGASSGLGQALARHYAACGASLGLVARSGERLQQLADELACQCAIYPLDVRHETALSAAAADFMDRFGVPHIVIASAGASCGTLTEQPDDIRVFADLMELNVTGVVRTFQPFVAAMREAGAGSLVGIASVAGFRGLPGASAYSASKAAVISYMESLRVELHGSGVDAITICPGYIATPMTSVNPYPMPFILSPAAAAGKVARVIKAKRRFAVIPWQMAIVAFFLKRLPNKVYDVLFAKAPHKPRNVHIQ
jgi:short-subunit dehydrogenase